MGFVEPRMWGMWGFGKYPEIVISIIYKAEGGPQIGASLDRLPTVSWASVDIRNFSLPLFLEMSKTMGGG